MIELIISVAVLFAAWMSMSLVSRIRYHKSLGELEKEIEQEMNDIWKNRKNY